MSGMFAGWDRFEVAAAAIAAVWLLVSLLFQTKKVRLVGYLKRFDHFAMIPAWSFFAPNPGTTDVHLLYRDRLVDGNVTLWKQVRWETPATRVLWNPYKRLQKGISDLTTDVHQYTLHHLKTAEHVLIYPGFIALLNFVSKQPHAPFAEFTQFCVARSFGTHSEKNAEVQFLSNFHRIES
jgi:hypothetical protein